MEKSTNFPLETRFVDWVLPNLLTSECFGRCSEIVEHDIDSGRHGKDQFSSTVQFYTIKVRSGSGERNVSVVVKFQPENKVLRESLGADLLFENEILMYRKILPLIDRDGIVRELFPEYYHGLANPSNEYFKDYVVIEDLGTEGYKLTDEKVFLDYDHCALVLKQLGKLHALSYQAKQEKRQEFMTAVSKIKDKWSVQRLTRWKYLLQLCGQRGIKPLIDNQEHVNFLTRFLQNYEDPVKFYSSLVEPLEDEAVLCHGDFCRNNMMFKYNSDGKPSAVKFFDLQTPRYSSPVIDLSFFLLMNTNKETREKYWDEFLNIYTESVNSTVPNNIEVPQLNFARIGVYGYLHCSFFLPIMMADNSMEVPLDVYLSSTPYDQGVCLSTVGGENETQLLVELIKFLLSKGYIKESYF